MEMRIVGLGCHAILIQEKNKSEWKQRSMRVDLFEEYMDKNFPLYFEGFMEANTSDETAAEYFYHYGETPEMIRKGEAYVFTSIGAN